MPVKPHLEALVLKLKEEEVVRGRKLRLDTTVVESNIHYPRRCWLRRGTCPRGW